MNKLVCDMTDVCKTSLTDEDIIELRKISNNWDDEAKSFLDTIISNSFSFNSRDFDNIPFEDIKEGDILIADVAKAMSFGVDWKHIHIDHIYRDVIFFTEIETDTKSHFDWGSLFSRNRIFPCYIIQKDGYNITCGCPLVKIVNNENEIHEEHRTYAYKTRN